VKLGVRDFVPGGLDVEEAVQAAVELERAGVDAIEVSAGVTSNRMESSQKYAGLSRRRALEDKMVHRLFAAPVPGSYFADDARRIRPAVSCPLILVGGLRRIDQMERLVGGGLVDFVSLGRPFIREPDLVRKVERGKRGEVHCVSCNICALHEGIHPIKCWRRSNLDLLKHAWYRFTGRLKPSESLGHPSENRGTTDS
jgi:2,4-dienoyl-CoA reductase-like NADH-dependent reductase (Old Yellow Enzyme family)